MDARLRHDLIKYAESRDRMLRTSDERQYVFAPRIMFVDDAGQEVPDVPEDDYVALIWGHMVRPAFDLDDPAKKLRELREQLLGTPDQDYWVRVDSELERVTSRLQAGEDVNDLIERASE